MELTAFTSRLGASQGRLSRAPDAPLLILGDDTPGYRHKLASGDHVELRQEADLTHAHLIRAHLHLTVPDDLPEHLAWEVSILIDGALRASAKGRAGRTRRLRDLAADVTELTGPHVVALRLQLVRA